MGLNESAMKLDAQLDVICKKVERVALDSAPAPMLGQDGRHQKLIFKFRNEERKFART
jgi:hypothetical protein